MSKYYKFILSSVALVTIVTTIGYYYVYAKCMKRMDYYISENKVIQTKLEENQDKMEKLAERSVKFTENKKKEDDTSSELAQGDEETIEDNYLSQMIDGDNSSTSVDASNMKITDKTKCINITYDIKTKEKNSIISLVPKEYVGLDRKSLINYLDEYIKNMPSDEENKGLLSMELISFSKDSVGILKRYDSSKTSEIYYIIAKDDVIMVYMGDRKTLYENTKINISKLPDEEKKKLEKGIVVESKDDLVSILESYSS